jgi:branched-chain amino acid transport system substrate-binding protein
MKRRSLTTITLALSLVFAFASADAREFHLGTQIPLTGSLARVGSATNEGIAVAVEIFNREHKGKHSVKRVIIDDESSPAKAVAAIEQMAGQVDAFSGGYGSNIIGPASEAAARLGKVYITSGGVARALVDRNLKTFFRINNGEGYAKAMIGLIGDMNVKSVSMVHSTKEATTDVANQVTAGLKAKGIKVTVHPFDPAITDFKPILHKIRLQDRPDVLAMIGYENDYVGILRAGQVLKPDVKAVVGVWSLATEQMAKEFPDLTEYVYGTSTLPYPPKFSAPAAQKFAAVYKELYGKSSDYLGVFGYVQTTLLLDAMLRAEEAGTLDKPGGLAEELRKTDTKTLIGRVKFSEGGDNPAFTHRMGQHQKDEVVLVWPADEATGKMVYPAKPW